MSFTTDLSRRRIEKIQHLLRRSDCTVQEIADGIFLSKRWVYAYIKHLHEDKKLIHIAEYRSIVSSNGSSFFTPVYCWGEAKDAKKPAALTASERGRRYRNHPEKGAERRAADARRKKAGRIKPVRDWTTSWIPVKQAA